MKTRSLIPLLALVAACGQSPENPQASVPAPEIRTADNGGVFVSPDADEPEQFCFIEHLTRTESFTVGGFALQGLFAVYHKDVSLEAISGDYVYLVDAEVVSDPESLRTFLRWGELRTHGQLIAWINDVPSSVTSVRPILDSSVDLADSGDTFEGGAVVKARFPKHETQVDIKLKFRRLYGCRDSN